MRSALYREGGKVRVLGVDRLETVRTNDRREQMTGCEVLRVQVAALPRCRPLSADTGFGIAMNDSGGPMIGCYASARARARAALGLEPVGASPYNGDEPFYKSVPAQARGTAAPKCTKYVHICESWRRPRIVPGFSTDVQFVSISLPSNNSHEFLSVNFYGAWSDPSTPFLHLA